MEIKVYNQTGQETGAVELSDAVFGLPWNADLVHQVVTGQKANLRPKVAHAKTRGEVRGGGKKPWRQKGTGRARHGSTRSPIWKGGGVTHGPNKYENYKKKINKKMAQKALFVVLSAKLRDKEIIVLENLDFAKPKTKNVSEIFKKIAKIEEFKRITKGNGALVALGGSDKNARLSVQNLPYAGMIEARNLTALDALQYKYVLFSKNTLEKFRPSVERGSTQPSRANVKK